MKKSVLDSSINWEFNQFDGTLRISGTGKMPRFTQNKESGGFDDNPWNPIKNEIATLIVDEGVVSVSGAAFWKCKNLTRAIMPHVLQHIHAGAFYECSALEEVAVEEIVTVGEGAFENCSSLRRIAPELSPSAKRKIESLVFVDECAFSGCESLDSVTFSNLKAIGRGAFYRCSSLQSVSCERLSSIAEHAFRECSSLSECRVCNGCVIAEGAFSKSALSSPTKFID